MKIYENCIYSFKEKTFRKFWWIFNIKNVISVSMFLKMGIGNKLQTQLLFICIKIMKISILNVSVFSKIHLHGRHVNIK